MPSGHKIQVRILILTPSITISKMRVSVIGSGNVGVAISADLSLSNHDVTMIKTSGIKSEAFDRILNNGNRVILKEGNTYTPTRINNVSTSLYNVANSDVIILALPNIYHEQIITKLSEFLHEGQIVVCICGYMSSLYFTKYCKKMPVIVETTGPYLEGRIELDDIKGEVVFRVGCRLTKSPLSIFQKEKKDETMRIIRELYKGFSLDYSTVESALLNPNMVLHTVGAIMSIPRIEYSHGNFCMYREAYSHDNPATVKLMLALDEEKKNVLKALGYKPTDIFVAGGFLGNQMESFYKYSESSDRAISPTSIHSRYITEDVSQGLVLMESIAKRIGVEVPLTSSFITIAGTALGVDFRATGRTLERLNGESLIDNCNKIA